MRGLVVDEPWISAILSGRKTWEMRKKACRLRERVALICKGSGLVVGVADVVDSLAPIGSLEAYAEAEGFHAIPRERQAWAFQDGWRTPWVLRSARALAAPVPYRHPAGAVIWVTLEPGGAATVESRLAAAA